MSGRKKIKIKYYSTLAIPAVIILLAILVPQHQARAGAWDFILGSSTLGAVATGITTMILAFVGTALSAFAGLLDKFIRYQTDSGIYGIFVVEQSWNQIRNFVNLFFILILIVMAFGTIFNKKGYTYSDLLPSFIISALLINFSLVIGQYIIAISNGLSGVFLKEIQSAGGISSTFAQGFNLASIATSGSTNIIDAGASVLMTGIFAIIFTAVSMLAFAAAAIFSVVRLFMLWFLLIISPFAWLGYALPNIRKRTWSAWWGQFLCWCFWLPLFLFFMMFAVIFVNNRDQMPPIQGSEVFAGLTGTNIMLYGLSLGFLVGGMYLAKKMACAGGSGASAIFGKIETGVRKYAPGSAYARGAAAGVKERGAEIAEKGVFGIGGAQRGRLQEAQARGFIAGAPGPGQVPGAKEAASRAQSAEVDKEVKKLQALNMNLDELNKKFESAKGLEKIAAFKIKAESGWLSAADLDNVNTMIDQAGGGRNAMGMSLISSLKKGKFQEMAKSTAEKELVFNGLKDAEAKKAFGLDMAESRELTSTTLAKELLDLYEGDTLETKKKVEEAVKNNIENIARKEDDRKNLLSGTGAYAGVDDRIKKLAGQVMADKKEVHDWKLRRQILELNGGLDATGEAKTVAGRNLAKIIGDNSAVIKEEAAYRKANPTIPHTADLDPTQRTELHEQILTNIEGNLITNFTTEELQTPEVFNALYYGVRTGRIRLDKFDRLAGLTTGGKKGGGKPDRKKREAGAKIADAAFRGGNPMPY